MIDSASSGAGRDYFFVISRVFQQGGDCTELCRWLETKTLRPAHRKGERERQGGAGQKRGGGIETRTLAFRLKNETKGRGERGRGLCAEGKILYLNKIT